MAAHSLVVPLAVGVLLLVGCRDGEDPEESAIGSSSPTASDPATPTATPSETVEPVTGNKFETNVVSMRLPEGWKIFQEDTIFWAVIDANRRRLSGGFTMFDGPSLGTLDLDRLARNFVQTEQGEIERADNRLVDGIEGWTVEGKAMDGDFVSAYGSVYDENRVEIRFKLELPEDEALALVDSVLASWKWKI